MEMMASAFYSAMGNVVTGIGSAVSNPLLAAAAGVNVAGAKMSADAGVAAAKTEQAQLNAAALANDAAAQHQAEQDRRKSDLMLSRALAVGAYGGGGVSGLDTLFRSIAAEGETAAGYSLYEGTEKAKELRYRGDIGVRSAKASGRATLMSAIANSAMSIAGKY